MDIGFVLLGLLIFACFILILISIRYAYLCVIEKIYEAELSRMKSNEKWKKYILEYMDNNDKIINNLSRMIDILSDNIQGNAEILEKNLKFQTNFSKTIDRKMFNMYNNQDDIIETLSLICKDLQENGGLRCIDKN